MDWQSALRSLMTKAGISFLGNCFQLSPIMHNAMVAYYRAKELNERQEE
jgi:hypothetical protein